MSDMKWTYVKDRLPEEDGDYIVATRWSVTDRRDGETYGQRHTMLDIAISSFDSGEFSNELVYAWMPLPTLPEEPVEDAGPADGDKAIPIEGKMQHKVENAPTVRDDEETIKKNLLNALEYEKKLNQQILGRLDAQRDIIKEMTGMLIEKATRG